MSDYQLVIKVRNAHLWRAIKAAGYKNVAQFCVANGLGKQQQHVGLLLAMKRSPLRKDGDWSQLALAISAAVRLDPEHLWPHHMRRRLERTLWTVDIDSPEALAAQAETPQIEAAGYAKAINRVMAQLPTRSQRVVVARFLDNTTLEDVAKEEGVTRERIRQIERKAVREMRRSLLKEAAAADIRQILEGA